jgi:hypothetical protein
MTLRVCTLRVASHAHVRSGSSSIAKFVGRITEGSSAIPSREISSTASASATLMVHDALRMHPTRRLSRTCTVRVVVDCEIRRADNRRFIRRSRSSTTHTRSSRTFVRDVNRHPSVALLRKRTMVHDASRMHPTRRLSHTCTIRVVVDCEIRRADNRRFIRHSVTRNRIHRSGSSTIHMRSSRAFVRALTVVHPFLPFATARWWMTLRVSTLHLGHVTLHS